MAARKNKIKLTEPWKEKIRVSMLLNRLQDHVLNKAEMKNSQIKAADILLRKVVPDLAKHEHTGEDGGPIVVSASWLAGRSVGASS